MQTKKNLLKCFILLCTYHFISSFAVLYTETVFNFVASFAKKSAKYLKEPGPSCLRRQTSINPKDGILSSYSMSSIPT